MDQLLSSSPSSSGTGYSEVGTCFWQPFFYDFVCVWYVLKQKAVTSHFVTA
jgi:hypothetical protein